MQQQGDTHTALLVKIDRNSSVGNLLQEELEAWAAVKLVAKVVHVTKTQHQALGDFRREDDGFVVIAGSDTQAKMSTSSGGRRVGGAGGEQELLEGFQEPLLRQHAVDNASELNPTGE